jgi:hypothetical protein
MIGPSVNDLVHSRAARELACIEKFSMYPGQQGLFSGPSQYQPTRALKVAVLRDYIKIATQILPDDTNLSKPTLWHSDLHTANIFVDPSQPTKITNIIDWQAVNIAPLFLQARRPSLIEFEGPIPEGFAPITLPAGFDDMSEKQQHAAKNLRAAQSLYKLYEILMRRQCPEIAAALRFQESLRGRITGLAARSPVTESRCSWACSSDSRTSGTRVLGRARFHSVQKIRHNNIISRRVGGKVSN